MWHDSVFNLIQVGSIDRFSVMVVQKMYAMLPLNVRPARFRGIIGEVHVGATNTLIDLACCC